MNKKRRINTRAMISILLLSLIIILFITGVGIQILDAIIEPEILIAQYLDPENSPKNILVEIARIMTAVHVITGFTFFSLSVVHIIHNYKTLKTYLKNL